MADYFRYGYIAGRDPLPERLQAVRRALVELGPEGEQKIEPYWSVLDAALNQRQGSETNWPITGGVMIDAFRYRMISDVQSAFFFPVASTPQCSLRSCSDMEASGSDFHHRLRRTRVR